MTRDEASKVLGLRPNATRKEIDAAYRRMASISHPDAQYDMTDREKAALGTFFQLINKAHSVLTAPPGIGGSVTEEPDFTGAGSDVIDVWSDFMQSHSEYAEDDGTPEVSFDDFYRNVPIEDLVTDDGVYTDGAYGEDSGTDAPTGGRGPVIMAIVAAVAVIAVIAGILLMRGGEGTAEPRQGDERQVQRERAQVPDLTGLNGSVAEHMITESGFEPRALDGKHSDTVEKGLVAKQSPRAGAEADEGSTVSYRLSLGPVDGPNDPTPAPIRDTFDADDSTAEVRYAVALYGIKKDKSMDGVCSLTFGPATGGYSGTQIHEPSGTTASGNGYRCLHDDTWNQIVFWANRDPGVYLQCIGNGCTHSVLLNIKRPLLASGYPTIEDGDDYSDGASTLAESISRDYDYWGGIPGASSIEGGWGRSLVRQNLNGSDALSKIYAADGGYADTSLAVRSESVSPLTSKTCVLSCFPRILRENIVAKKVMYDPDPHRSDEAHQMCTYDKLWLLSTQEIYGRARAREDDAYGSEDEYANIAESGTAGRLFEAPLAGPRYERFMSMSTEQELAAYDEFDDPLEYWTRSLADSEGGQVCLVDTRGIGVINSANSISINESGRCGISPCFCLGEVK